MLDVIEVVFQFFAGLGQGGAVAIPDLRPSGEAGADHVAQVVKGQVFRKIRYKLWPFRPGTYQAHVAPQHVPKLRNFVDAGFAHEHAEFGNARIVFDGPFCPGSLSIGAHGAEFINMERRPACTDARLPEEDWTF